MSAHSSRTSSSWAAPKKTSISRPLSWTIIKLLTVMTGTTILSLVTISLLAAHAHMASIIIGLVAGLWASKESKPKSK